MCVEGNLEVKVFFNVNRRNRGYIPLVYKVFQAMSATPFKAAK